MTVAQHRAWTVACHWTLDFDQQRFGFRQRDFAWKEIAGQGLQMAVAQPAPRNKVCNPLCLFAYLRGRERRSRRCAPHGREHRGRPQRAGRLLLMLEVGEDVATARAVHNAGVMSASCASDTPSCAGESRQREQSQHPASPGHHFRQRTKPPHAARGCDRSPRRTTTHDETQRPSGSGRVLRRPKTGRAGPHRL